MNVRLVVFSGLATALASTVLYPLFASAGWFWAGIGAIAVICLATLATTRLGFPLALCPFAELALLVVYLTGRYAGDVAFAWIVPTPHALDRLWTLAGHGFDEIDTYAAPVPGLAGVSLLSTVGIGAVALVVNLLAVRLRRAALAGLPLLALYTVPVAISDSDVGWLSFVAGAGGYLMLLAVESADGLAIWGGLARAAADRGHTRAERADVRPLLATGRKVGLTALAIAVVVPLVVPAPNPAGLFGLGAARARGGATTITTPNPIVGMRGALTRHAAHIVLTYRTDDPRPDYLRMYALDRFSGDSWSMSTVVGGRDSRVRDHRLPAAPGLDAARSRTAHTRVRVDSHVKNMHFLPLPYPATKVAADGDWRADAASLMVFSARSDAAGHGYRVVSRHLTPSPGQLASASSPSPAQRRYLRLPHLPAAIRALSRHIVRGASSDYGKAVAIQRWFTSGRRFTYTVDRRSGSGMSALTDFLLRDRTGYCEQFATAMALLARENGIPARVAVGYTAGTKEGNRWVVTTRDAHAWPELYFQGYGWTRFEPTPGGPGGQGTAVAPAYSMPAASGNPGQPGGGPSTTQEQGLGRHHGSGQGGKQPIRPRGGAAPATPSHIAHHRSPWWPPLAGVVALLLALLMVPAIVRYRVRRRRVSAIDGVGAAHAAWGELCDGVTDLGLDLDSSDTPRRVRAKIAGWLDSAPSRYATAHTLPALDRLVTAEEQARYASVARPGNGLLRDADAVRSALSRTRRMPARLKARVLPRSGMLATRNRISRRLTLIGSLGRRVRELGGRADRLDSTG